MDVNQASKRRAEEDLEKTDKRPKSASTPRTLTKRRSTMAEPRQESEQISSSIINDLKIFIQEKSAASDDKVAALFETVNGRVEKNSKDILDIKDAIKRIESKQQSLTETPTNITPGHDQVEVARQVSPTRQAEKYTLARRSLRLWPIRGDTDAEIRSETIRFIRTKLDCNDAACPDSSIVRTRRTRQPRRSKIGFEVLVTFADRFARDAAASNAKNLAEYKDIEGNATAGLRLNYPDYMGPDFRVLEWYGAEMRRIHKEGTKRSIKYDDELMCLCIDVKLPSNEEWLRVHPKQAREHKARRTSDSTERAKRILETPVRPHPFLTPPQLSTTPATGSNATYLPQGRLPIMSSSSMLASQSTPTVNNSPDNIIYISPRKRQ